MPASSGSGCCNFTNERGPATLGATTHYMRRSTDYSSAVLAAMLPAPRQRNPRRPSKHLRERATEVLELYQVYHQLSPGELAQARGRLAALLP